MAFTKSVLDSLKTCILLLDSEGTVLETNAAWREFCRKYGMSPGIDWKGTNYLSVCDLGEKAGVEEEISAADGIRAILWEDRTEYQQIITCHSPSEKRWYNMRATKMTGAGAARVMVSYEDVSEIMQAKEDISEARDRSEVLAVRHAQRERFITAITNAMPSLVAYWDKNLICRFANAAYLNWFDKLPDAVIGISLLDLLGERLFSLNEPYIRGVLAGERQIFERTLTKTDGSVRHTLANYIPDIDADGTVVGFFVLVSDVTLLKKAEEQARGAEIRLKAIVNSVIDGIIVIDGKGQVVSINPATVRMFGYSTDELVGKNVKILMPEPDSSRHDIHLAHYRSTGKTSVIGVGRELEGQTKDGKTFPIELAVTEVAVNDERLFIGLLRDITERKRAQDLLAQLATTDGLTGLANRRRFDEFLDYEYAAHSRSGAELSLILLDIDHFKAFNDHYGHVKGDDCLRQVSQAIREVIVRGTDLAARYGGEEFACILPMTKARAAVRIAQKIRQVVSALAIPHRHSSIADHVTASLGVVTVRCVPGGWAPSIIELADKQLYAAKSTGRNRVCADSAV